MNDQYGNYFCQKIFKVLETSDRLTFLNKMRDSVEFIGTDQIGSHAFQNLISGLCNLKEKKLMISIIEDNFHFIINDKLGVHIVERLIICFEECLVKRLYNMILKDFLPYSNNANSLCVVSNLYKYRINIIRQRESLTSVRKKRQKTG